MTTHRPQDATPTPEHDAVLLHALRHAPEPASSPSDTVRAHVLHHATQSIAIKSYKSSGNGQKTSENTLRQGWLRLRNAIRIHLQRWGSARYTGAVASVMVAVLVGLLWHDDDRRAEGMEDSVAAASVPAPAAQPETSVPVTSVPQAEAAGPAQEQLARAKAATPALQ